jgi:hypothetical protein
MKRVEEINLNVVVLSHTDGGAGEHGGDQKVTRDLSSVHEAELFST